VFNVDCVSALSILECFVFNVDCVSALSIMRSEDAIFFSNYDLPPSFFSHLY
jgi:hypothetical protein